MGNAPKLTKLTDEQLKLTYACKCGVKHFLTPVKKLWVSWPHDPVFLWLWFKCIQNSGVHGLGRLRPGRPQARPINS